MSLPDAKLEFGVLGPLEVRQGMRSLPVRGWREQAVLGMLLLAEGDIVSIDRLVEAVWDGDPPPGAVKAVRNSVSALRRRAANSGGAAVPIEAAPTGYRLPLHGSRLDALDFRRQVDEARLLAAAGHRVAGHRATGHGATGHVVPAAVTAAAVALRSALSLWRGPVLAGTGGRLLQDWAAPLHELRIGALEDCLDLELAHGRHREVTAELRALAREWPLRERIWGQLMLALYRSGRQGEALDAYYRLAKRLARDLGIDPGADLSRLHGAILRHDPSLDLHRGHAHADGRPHTGPDLCRWPGDRYEQAYALMSIGDAERRLGRPSQAARRYRQALGIFLEGEMIALTGPTKLPGLSQRAQERREGSGVVVRGRQQDAADQRTGLFQEPRREV